MSLALAIKRIMKKGNLTNYEYSFWVCNSRLCLCEGKRIVNYLDFLSVDKDSNAIGNHLNWMGNYYLDRFNY